MNKEEYNNFIISIVNKLIREKCVNPKINKDINLNKIAINIAINTPKWYNELDHVTKYNVEYNLRLYYTPIIRDYLQDFNNSKLEKYNDETLDHLAKRFKFDKNLIK